MRSLILAAATALTLTACASQAPAPQAAATPAKPAPQCYSGDHGKFFDVGAKAAISGVDVVCEKTSDGKAAQWMGAKAKH
ncbi:hypothetical protein [Dechloromonas hortensis]|uniref:hypothetical protein n=1 Tax=Dechloromonas hortensis TaxID=337779 RepID=UPI001290B971|nr:hypothetical protein [Dechloromonas hortensis]